MQHYVFASRQQHWHPTENCAFAALPVLAASTQWPDTPFTNLDESVCFDTQLSPVLFLTENMQVLCFTPLPLPLLQLLLLRAACAMPCLPGGDPSTSVCVV
jgi:hypothetical protein